MTVQELIDRLNKIKNKERLVLLSSDGEGNSFDTLHEIKDAYNCEKAGYEYFIKLEKLTPELETEGYTEEDVMKDGNPCIVLWP